MNKEETEENCTKCKQTITENNYYKCDSCLQKVHKACWALSASEAKCMPLQKRLLLLICDDCKTLLVRMPYMMKVLENMRKDVEHLKQNISAAVLLGANEKSPEKPLYSDVIKTNNVEKSRISNTPTLIIKPKQTQEVKETKKDIQQYINPTDLKIGIKNLTSTKKGTIIVKCTNKEDMEKLKTAAENSLRDKYIVEAPKLKAPRIKITGYTGMKSEEEIEKYIRNQNSWVDTEDNIKITYVRKDNRKSQSTIFAECSAGLYYKMMKYGRVCIGWERCPVYEDLNITRCFNCQGYYHKSAKCNQKTICGNCGNEHETSSCQTQEKKCNNCATANTKYNKQYNVGHAVMDPDCPSTRYHIEVMRSKINYST